MSKEEAGKKIVSSSFGNDLCLNFILASEHVVNLGQVVCTGEECVRVAGRLEILLQVGVLTQDAHLEETMSVHMITGGGKHWFLTSS